MNLYAKDTAQLALDRLAGALLPDGWLIIELKTPPLDGEFGPLGQPACEVEDLSDGSTLFSTSVWSTRDAGRVIRNWTKYERYIKPRPRSR